MASNGGISSLSGFAYQIKVFVYYLEKLQDNMEIGYETFEDVAIKYKPDDLEYIDKKCVDFNSLLKTSKGITAIQVKKKKLDAKDFKQLLYNWILLEMSDDPITNYILLMDSSYNNSDLIFDKSALTIYDEIVQSNEDVKSLKSQIKNIIDNDFSKFENAYNNIRANYEFKEIVDMDEMLNQVYGKTFHKPSVNSKVYECRIKALLSKITCEIMESVVKNKSYTCKYDDLIHFLEEICQDISDKEIYTDFSIFKSLNHISLKDTEIAMSRQYKQLCACFYSENKIEEHLVYEQYYNDYKLGNLENMKKYKIDTIEDTTYSHFTDAKEYLNNINNDKPFFRLDETKKRGNSYTLNEQIYYGSAIHLTKEDIEKKLLISWKDVKDEY
ncbi:hypothetical protein [Lacrimispora algidixylanolytica]|uniref:Uncharacterized protein n=1 Tax=Lacrimispora algidixylanolytica TaxID=94868 RepID=A0A419T036_9FIRM|nr:hypothetical protein [Lacrimispora algidixylanolytica]RKD30822.1 hypothetical protein BET01_05770 [Lacrimispora algidixylanolytica]